MGGQTLRAGSWGVGFANAPHAPTGAAVVGDEFRKEAPEVEEAFAGPRFVGSCRITTLRLGNI